VRPTIKSTRKGVKGCLFTCIFLCFLTIPLHADEPRWYENFFLEASALNYFAPEILSEFLKPALGFRAAFGYEYNNIRLALESGYSYIEGTNPLVTEINFIPVVLKFGYAFPFINFGVQADLNFGCMFSRTSFHRTALDVVLENLIEESEISPLLGIRLYAFWLPLSFLKIYAGGGMDIIFERDGPIPLPLLEAGISFKPFALIRSLSGQRVGTLQNAVYFDVNSVLIDAQYMPVLDDTGNRLRDNPSQRLTLRAYYTREGAERQVLHTAGDPALSASRAQWCIEYLLQNYGIDSSRITIQYRDAQRRSEYFRAIQLIIN